MIAPYGFINKSSFFISVRRKKLHEEIPNCIEMKDSLLFLLGCQNNYYLLPRNSCFPKITFTNIDEDSYVITSMQDTDLC